MLFEKFAHNAHVFCNLFRSLITSQKSSDHNGRSRGLQALKHKPEIKWRSIGNHRGWLKLFSLSKVPLLGHGAPGAHASEMKPDQKRQQAVTPQRKIAPK
jgi:hypothetical protein